MTTQDPIQAARMAAFNDGADSMYDTLAAEHARAAAAPDAPSPAGGGDAVAVLGELEWNNRGSCPLCKGLNPLRFTADNPHIAARRGHSIGCRLAAALANHSPGDQHERVEVPAEEARRIARDVERRYPSIKQALGREYAEFLNDFWRAIRNAREDRERVKALEAEVERLRGEHETELAHFSNWSAQCEAEGFARGEERGRDDMLEAIERADSRAIIAEAALAARDETIRELREATAWRDIKSAPRDGTPLWLASAVGLRMSGQTEGLFAEHLEHWVDAGFKGIWPTHWMPLPEPPRARAALDRTAGNGSGDGTGEGEHE